MLDPSKLKAGFAGMQLDAALLPAKLSALKGLQLNVLNAAAWRLSGGQSL